MHYRLLYKRLIKCQSVNRSSCYCSSFSCYSPLLCPISSSPPHPPFLSITVVTVIIAEGGNQAQYIPVAASCVRVWTSLRAPYVFRKHNIRKLWNLAHCRGITWNNGNYNSIIIILKCSLQQVANKLSNSARQVDVKKKYIKNLQDRFHWS